MLGGRLNYQDVITNPKEEFKKLLIKNWPIDIIKASKVVNPSLYRFRLERLTIGI